MPIWSGSLGPNSGLRPDTAGNDRMPVKRRRQTIVPGTAASADQALAADRRPDATGASSTRSADYNKVND
jgi:hypothetical protein